MPDYSTWALAESLTVEEAACLWAGVDPASYGNRRYASNDPAAGAVAPRLRMLSSALESGALQGDTSKNGFVSIGDHSRTLVTREALMTFAALKNERPAFLFDTLMPARGNAEDGDPSPKNKGGAPGKWDWDGCMLEIVRIANGIDGLPEKQSELVDQLARWFVSQVGEHPSESQIRVRTSRVYKYLAEFRKPPAG